MSYWSVKVHQQQWLLLRSPEKYGVALDGI